MLNSSIKDHTFRWCDLLFLTLIIGLLFGFTLGSFPLEVPDGARYAEIPREMIVNHDYLIPHLNGFVYLEKPPLFYWLQVGAIKIFGLGEWSLHIVNAFMALLTCFLIYIAGCNLYDRRTGFLASLVLATSVLFFALARVITLDMTFTAFLSGALLSFILGVRAPPGRSRNFYMWAMYFFAALATMTKGLIGIIFPGLIIFSWIAIFNEWRNLKTYCLFSGTFLFLLIVAPWHILVGLKIPDFFRFYFFEQHFLRYFTPSANREQGVWFLPAVFLIGFFPWIFFLPAVIKKYWPRSYLKKISDQTKANCFFLLWAGIIFVFYSFSDSKLATYILPIFPSLALLTGNYLREIQDSSTKRLVLNIRTYVRKLVSLQFASKPKCEAYILFYGYCSIAFILGLGLIVAIRFFDFHSYTAFSNFNLYLIAIGLLFSGIATYIGCRYFNIKTGLIILFITTMFFLFTLIPLIGIGNGKSNRPLITTLQSKLKPDDLIVSYKNYYQDLPYYLSRIIPVIDFYGELKFGILHSDQNSRFLKTDAFWQIWNNSQNMFLLTDIGYYAEIQKNAKKDKLYLVDRLRNRFLFANHPV
jgi:hypothetical protein